MSLSDEERMVLVKYRLEKSHTTLEQAKGNIELEYWETVANRLYYAAYYAVSALLLNNGLSVQTHSGIIQMLGYHFVKKGIISDELGKHYSRLFSMRQTGDYGDTFGLTAGDIMPMVEPTEKLIALITELLNQQK